MAEFTLRKPSPDFESFEKVLRGEKKPERAYLVELYVDEEVVRFVTENILGRKWVSLTEETKEEYWKQWISFYYSMGYDFVPLPAFWINLPSFKGRETTDTASPSGGRRTWAEEGRGIITSWEELEKFPWDQIKSDFWVYDFVEKHLPQGMMLTVSTGSYGMVIEWLLGYEGLFYLLYDDLSLVERVFEEWGKKVNEFYVEVIEREKVRVIAQGDDLGYKNGTMLSPDILRRMVFPWFKEYASLAHKHGKMFWHHCCGNVLEIMKDLIEDIGIDAFHSFQDVIIPVAEFKKVYGDRIAALGGVDVDKLARLDEVELRRYVRNILDSCMPDGRYALGSGNSIANYIPPENYLVMIDEGLKWTR